MKFHLINYFSKEITEKSNLTSLISTNLNAFFQFVHYSKHLNSIYVGVICVNKDFEHFFTGRKAIYRKTIKNQTVDALNPENGSIIYDIKIDFDKFYAANEIECYQMITKELFNSLETLPLIKKKLSIAEYNNFKNDLFTFFEKK